MTFSYSEHLCSSSRKTDFISLVISLKTYKPYGQHTYKITILGFYFYPDINCGKITCALRSHGGHNNNSTPKQAAYNKLLMYTDVVGSTQSNWVQLTPTIILARSGDKVKNKASQLIDTRQAVIVQGINEEHNYVVIRVLCIQNKEIKTAFRLWCLLGGHTPQ